MRESTLFVGLDESKDSIAVAIAEPGRAGEVRDYGTIANTPEALTKLVRKLGRPRDLSFAVEAGPCGYETYRNLKSLGAECIVVAPSKTPRRPGDRIKNDRRDAATLARLHRAGELTAVWVPDTDSEAMRDLTRSREDAKYSEAPVLRSLLRRRLLHGRKWCTDRKRRNEKVDHPRQAHPGHQPHHATRGRKHDRFAQEQPKDLLRRRPDRLRQADLARPLVHGGAAVVQQVRLGRASAARWT